MRRALPVLVCLSLLAAGCRESGDVTVHSLDFKGVQAVDKDRLAAALVTKVSSKLPWGRQHFFDRSRFDQDLQRIKAFYEDRGYPDARVTGVDARLNQDQTAVDLVVTIDEGLPIVVAAVQFEGFEVIPPDRLQWLRNQVVIKADKPRDRQLVVASHDTALNELRDHGYPYARVDTSEAADGDRRVNIVFRAEPGVLAHFGPIDITGNSSVGQNVIRREMDYRPGDLYRRSAVQNSQRRLYNLALFQFVNLETTGSDTTSPEVPTHITIVEGKHQRLNLGAGYGSEEKARVDAEYRHVNFFGGARSAGIHARYSGLDRGVRVDFNQPYFFRPRFSLGADGQQWYSYTPAYNSVVLGGHLAVTRRPLPDTFWSLSISSERSSSTISDQALNDPELRDDLIAIGLDPTTNKQEGTLSAIGFDFQRSTADNLLNPTKGFHLNAHLEEAGVLLPGTFEYYAISIEGRQYQRMSDDLIVATRLQLGNIDSLTDSAAQVPFSKKFFLGGATSLRGWGRYEVGPLSSTGLPLGGNTMMEFSAEARAHLRGNLGGVLFLDTGNVWESASHFALSDLRYAIGTGIRYQTPVGPIRLDFGYQVNPIQGLIIDGEPQKRRYRLHFSIGQAY
jgi:outer membrane protein assembly complex protein YaeT